MLDNLASGKKHWCLSTLCGGEGATVNLRTLFFQDVNHFLLPFTGRSDVVTSTPQYFTTTTTFLYNTTSDLYNASMASSSRRRLLATETDTGVPGIPNPIYCVELEDMMVFRVAIDYLNRSLSSYPTYKKDHLFNTNPTFDYSEFRDLAYYVRNTNVTIDSFAYVFTESGQYVFADAQESQWEVIVSVMASGSSCDSTRSVVQPSSPSNLYKERVGKQEAQNEEPDWALIIGKGMKKELVFN